MSDEPLQRKISNPNEQQRNLSEKLQSFERQITVMLKMIDQLDDYDKHLDDDWPDKFREEFTKLDQYKSDFNIDQHTFQSELNENSNEGGTNITNQQNFHNTFKDKYEKLLDTDYEMIHNRKQNIGLHWYSRSGFGTASTRPRKRNYKAPAKHRNEQEPSSLYDDSKNSYFNSYENTNKNSSKVDSNQNSKNTQNAVYNTTNENKNTNSNKKTKENANFNESGQLQSFNFIKEIKSEDIAKEENDRINKIHEKSIGIKDAADQIRTSIIDDNQRMGDLVKVYEPVLNDVTKGNQEMEQKVSKGCNCKYVTCYIIILIMALAAIVVGLLYIFKVQ